MAPSARFERATPSFGGKYSNPLSYEGVYSRVAAQLPYYSTFLREFVPRATGYRPRRSSFLTPPSLDETMLTPVSSSGFLRWRATP